MTNRNTLLISLIVLVVVQIKLCAQEVVNPIASQPESIEFKQYVKMIDERNITKIRRWNKNLPKGQFTTIASMEEKDVKKLVSLAFFSRFYNPREYRKKVHDFAEIVRKDRTQKTKSYTAADYLFLKKEQYQNFKFENKHILYDLYFAPFVFIGTITDIDTLFDRGDYLKIIKYEMIISDNMNTYYKKDVVNKKLIFTFSTGHWGTFDLHHGPHSYITPKEIYYKMPPKQGFIIGNKYLIFLANTIYDYFQVDDIYKNLPALRLTAYTNLNFPVENSLIYDHFGYLGKGEKSKLSIEDVKRIINAIIDELVNWKE